MSTLTNSEVWLAAIANGEKKMRRSGGGGDASDAANYLRHLNDLLRGVGRERWNEPPSFVPPRPLWEQQNNQGLLYPEHHPQSQADPYAFQPPQGYHTDAYGLYGSDVLADDVASSLPVLPASTQSTSAAAADRNPFSAFDDGDSNSDDDEASDEKIVYRAPSTNGGGSGSSHQPVSSEDGGMSVRRILLRVYCSLAEVHSQWAVQCSRDRDWVLGADEFEIAFGTIRLGQEILDEEHAFLAQCMELTEDDKVSRDVRRRRECIANDTDAVSVMLAFFSESRDKYLHAATKRVAFLEGKLFQDDATRREIMSTMGSRWRSNPNPSNDYAEKRKILERELEDVLAGMNRTQGMNVNGLGK